MNAFNNGQTSTVYSSGRAWVEAPPRGYAIYVQSGDYVAYSAPSARSGDFVNGNSNIENELNKITKFQASDIYPNPITQGYATLDLDIPENGIVNIQIIDVFGRTERTMEFQKDQGHHSIRIDVGELSTGYYIYKIVYGGTSSLTKPFLIRN